MDSSDDAKLNDTMEPMGKEQLTTRLSEISRKSVDESRQQGRTTTITKRRFGKDILKQTDEENNGTGSQSGFEPEAEKSPVPAGSGDSQTSPNGVSRSIASNEPEEERAISFWGALKIPVSLTLNIC